MAFAATELTNGKECVASLHHLSEHVVWGNGHECVLDRALASAYACGSSAPSITFLESDDDSTRSEEEDEGVAPAKTTKKNKKHRPCKGQRMRYQSQLERLRLQISYHPFVDLEKLELPPGVAKNNSVKAKMLKSLNAHQVGLMQSFLKVNAKVTATPALVKSYACVFG